MPTCVQTNVSLAPHTTLGVGGVAEYFASVYSIAELREVVAWAKETGHAVHVLGAGSNALISDAGVTGLVVQPCMTDVSYEEVGAAIVHATVGAGVVLDAWIADTVERALWGVENLSGIPGSVGATPVQNVGAYGVEVSDVIVAVHVYNTETEKEETLNADACAFAYRDSIFKKANGEKYIITAVTYALSRTASPHLGYKDLALHFNGVAAPTLADIRAAVIAIRSEKFPDWHVVGTAGSFFKNPIITSVAYEALVQKYPDIPAYPDGTGMVKLSLGYILDKVCGLKGHAEGRVRLYEKQALVLVCEQGATAREIDAFAQKVSDVVFEKTGVRIEREVTEF